MAYLGRSTDGFGVRDRFVFTASEVSIFVVQTIMVELLNIKTVHLLMSL